MKIYQSPEINVEEISTTDIMQTSPQQPNVPGSGLPIRPKTLSDSGSATTTEGYDVNGFDFGGTFGNL